MSYERVIPRDLFNEASLLKCYGRLYILLEDNPLASFPDESLQSFDVVQSLADGSLSIENLPFTIRGRKYRLWRPLNARGQWPLYASLVNDPDFEEVAVFDDAGNLSAEMKKLVWGD